MDLRKHRLLALAIPIVVVVAYANLPASAALGPGVGNPPPQGTQTNQAYKASYWANGVTNVFATTQQTSCYTPEIQYGANAGPNDGYSGQTACNGAATTGENLGPYAQQSTSNPPYGVGPPDLVKDHSESDIRVDPTNPSHLIGSVKWFASAEGYNHVLGFYESWDGGQSWPVQGHIPGYEGWTDNTDPVGAFDGFGNFYELILPYQFFYNSDGSHNFATNPNHEPNPALAAEVISVSVRKHGATGASAWSTANGTVDIVAPYDKKGQEPDKQWLTIDTNKFRPDGSLNPNYNTIYAMWAVFDGINSKPFVSTAKALQNATHTPWSAPIVLPTVNNTASDTYLLPHVTPDGTVYTSVTNFPGNHGFCCITVSADRSTDGGKTWTFLSTAVSNILVPSFVGGYANTTFTDGIDNTFAVGLRAVNGKYPLYISYNDDSAGVSNVMLTASFDGGSSWTPPIKVNDNALPVDEFQPNLAAASDGTVSVNFYDRRLACPAAGTAEAAGAGLALDQVNVNYSGSLPPYSASNYCVNTSIQFYDASLSPIGHNIRLSQHTWDPQLNSPIRFCVCEPNATFVGDYFGNTFAGSTSYTTSVSTYNDGSNPANRQQQVVGIVAAP